MFEWEKCNDSVLSERAGACPGCAPSVFWVQLRGPHRFLSLVGVLFRVVNGRRGRPAPSAQAVGENVCWYVVLFAGLPVHYHDNTPLGEMPKKKKTVLEILEVIVHSLLAPLFGGCGVAKMELWHRDRIVLSSWWLGSRGGKTQGVRTGHTL